jgi:hypothetical protein
MVVMKNFAFHRLGGSRLPSHFASCPPPFGLLLYLRKAPRQTALGVGVLRGPCTTTFVALGVVCLPQRSQGGGRRPGDMSGGRYTAPEAERTAPKAERAAHNTVYAQ